MIFLKLMIIIIIISGIHNLDGLVNFLTFFSFFAKSLKNKDLWLLEDPSNPAQNNNSLYIAFLSFFRKRLLANRIKKNLWRVEIWILFPLSPSTIFYFFFSLRALCKKRKASHFKAFSLFIISFFPLKNAIYWFPRAFSLLFLH